MENFEKALVIGLTTFFTIIIIVTIHEIQVNPPSPIPLREVRVCNNINHTSTLCYKYWARIGPASDAN